MKVLIRIYGNYPNAQKMFSELINEKRIIDEKIAKSNVENKYIEDDKNKV